MESNCTKEGNSESITNNFGKVFAELPEKWMHEGIGEYVHGLDVT